MDTNYTLGRVNVKSTIEATNKKLVLQRHVCKKPAGRFDICTDNFDVLKVSEDNATSLDVAHEKTYGAEIGVGLNQNDTHGRHCINLKACNYQGVIEHIGTPRVVSQSGIAMIAMSVSNNYCIDTRRKGHVEYYQVSRSMLFEHMRCFF